MRPHWDFEPEVWITDCAARFDAVSPLKYTVIDHPTSVFFLIAAWLSRISLKSVAQLSHTSFTLVMNTVVFKGERFKNESTLDVKTHYKPTFNIEISTHTVHPTLKMVSVKAKHWDCSELTLLTNTWGELWENSNDAWGHAAIQKQS